MQVTLPRIVLPEFNTHRVFSRNSASSRAIPVNKMIDKAVNDPFIPSYWGKAQKGMQAFVELSKAQKDEAIQVWLRARDKAVEEAKELLDIGVHKQLANRLLEPFLWHVIVVTATEWDNFFKLRIHADAQPEIMYAAEAMKKALDSSEPQIIEEGEWHMPFVRLELVPPWIDARMASAARCARVSYLNHDGKESYESDNDLATRLLESGHLSPFEHVATPGDKDTGNFKGWTQFRQVVDR
jgi:thymidylate synthase ThyX